MLTGNLAIACKSCKNLFMTKILAPRLKFFRAGANLLTELNKDVSKTMRIEIRKTGIDKGIFKYLADWGSGTPVRLFQPCNFKLLRMPQLHTN